MKGATRRVVITGVGAVTSVGATAPAFWQALVAGESGVAPISSFDARGARPHYAAEVKDFSPDTAGVPRKKLKMMGRSARLAYAAALEASVNAGLSGVGASVDPSRVGVMLGVGMLNADPDELGRAFHAAAWTGAPSAFDMADFSRAAAQQMFPLWLLRHIPNLAAAHVAIGLDAQAPSNTIATGCVAGANALGEAARVIARNDADVVFAGGADARVNPFAMIRYRRLGWLSTRDDVDPRHVSAPFDASASGFVTGEGAGVLVLESEAHARARGATILAEFAGYGAANDAGAFFSARNDGDGLRRAVDRASGRAGLLPGRVDAVFAPATGVPAFDAAIARGLETIDDGPAPPVTATRSLLGHAHAASAAIDGVAAVMALRDGLTPPVANVTQPLTRLPLVRDESLRRDIESVLVGSAGFGGHAAAFVLRRYAS